MTQVSAKPFELVAAFDRAAYDVMPLIDFCETFFREFIAEVLGRQVQAFDRREARQVAKAARGATKEVDGVLRLFGSFCDTYDNVSHLSYVAMMEGGATNRELTHFVDSLCRNSSPRSTRGPQRIRTTKWPTLLSMRNTRTRQG